MSGGSHLELNVLATTKTEEVTGAYNPHVPTRKDELVRFLLRQKRVGKDAERAHKDAQPSSRFCAYKADFQGTILRIYVPKDLGGRMLREAVRFQLGGDNGIGKALELGNSRSSFKGNRDKIKEGKNLMSVISLGEALSFLDRTTKDRSRAQAMKRFIQLDVLPKLERAELAPWSGTVMVGPTVPGLTNYLKKLLYAAEKLDSLLKIPLASELLREVKDIRVQKVEHEVIVVLVGEAGSGKSHLGNRLVCPGSDGRQGPFQLNHQPSRATIISAVKKLESTDSSMLNVTLRPRSPEDFLELLRALDKQNPVADQELPALGCSRLQGVLQLSAGMPPMPEVVGNLFPLQEVDQVQGGPFAKMQHISSEICNRLSKAQALAVDLLLFESPAINLPNHYVLVDTIGATHAALSLPLQILLARADVMVPCARQRGMTEESMRQLFWDGLFQRASPPIFLIPLDYLPLGMDDMLPVTTPADSKQVQAAHLEKVREQYRKKLGSSFKNPRFLPSVDIQQRLQLCQLIEEQLEVLPLGTCSLADHPHLITQLKARENRSLLRAACTCSLLIAGVLNRHGLQPKVEIESPDAQSEGAGLEHSWPAESAVETSIAEGSRSFSSKYTNEMLLVLEAARTDIQDFLEACVEPGGTNSEPQWTIAANYIMGVLRQTFIYLGSKGAALRLDQQFATVAALSASGLPARGHLAAALGEPWTEMKCFLAASDSAMEALWECHQANGLETALGVPSPNSMWPGQRLLDSLRSELSSVWDLHTSADASDVARFAEEMVCRIFRGHLGYGWRLQVWAQETYVKHLNQVAQCLLQAASSTYRPVDERKRTLGELAKLAVQFQEVATGLLKLTSDLPLRSSSVEMFQVAQGGLTHGSRGELLEAQQEMLLLPPVKCAEEEDEVEEVVQKSKALPLREQRRPEALWISELPAECAQSGITCPFAWFEFTQSPAKSKSIRVGQWAERSLNWYEHLSKHSPAPLESICPPVFFISKEPFAEAALQLYWHVQETHPARSGKASKRDSSGSSRSSQAELFTLAFVIVEKHQILELGPAVELPPHTWPLVIPDNSHPAEYCEAAKLVAESLLNFGISSYALIPGQISVQEFAAEGCSQRQSSLTRALRFGQSLLDSQRQRLRKNLVASIGQRRFKTELVNLAMDDAFASPEGREAFRRFNHQFDAVISPQGALQGNVDDLINPLLPKVKERLESMMEQVHMVSCVSFAHSTFAVQRHLILHPSNFGAGTPPSLATLNDIESQTAFSYCRPAILDDILVPPGCGEEEFLQQWRMVQKLYYQQVQECGRRCLWTAQFHIQSLHMRDPTSENSPVLLTAPPSDASAEPGSKRQKLKLNIATEATSGGWAAIQVQPQH